MASGLEAGDHSRYRMHDILEAKPYAALEAESHVDRRGRSTGARVRVRGRARFGLHADGEFVDRPGGGRAE